MMIRYLAGLVLLCLMCCSVSLYATQEVSYLPTQEVPQIFSKKKKKHLVHIVNYGETLSSIVKRYGIPLSVVLLDNPSLTESNIKVGQQLFILRKDMNSATPEQIDQEFAALSLPKEPQDIQPPKKDTIAVKQEVAEEQVQADLQHEDQQADYRLHTVASGETLFSLARANQMTVPQLRALNGDVLALSSDGLQVGMVIKLPKDATSSRHVTLAFKEEDYARIIGSRAKNRDFNRSPMNISLLLPFTEAGKRSPQYAEFYQGFLLSLDSLKKDGISVDLKVFDTQKSRDKVVSIINSGELNVSDLIIGPVYDETFCEVARFAEKIKVPIVSPLAVPSCSNPYVFQVSSDEETRYDKIAAFLKEKNVIIYKSVDDDGEFIEKITALAGGNVKIISFDPKADPENLGSVLDTKKESVFVVAPTTERLTDALLSKLSAVKKTSHAPKPMSVLVTSRITRMNSLDPAYFFLLNLYYTTSYHIDRTNKDVMKFDNKYIRFFNKVPSLYAYRGYDTGLFFVDFMKLLAGDFCSYIDSYKVMMLQSKYHFVRKSPGDSFKNKEWLMINYTPSYNIIVN